MLSNLCEVTKPSPPLQKSTYEASSVALQYFPVQEPSNPPHQTHLIHLKLRYVLVVNDYYTFINRFVIDLLISNWFTDQDLLVKDDINTWTTNKGPMIVECWVIF